MPERSAAVRERIYLAWRASKARTTGAAAAGANLRKLAVCKTLAIEPDPVQETRVAIEVK